MRAWIKRGGRLELEDVPQPVPASDELLVRACAYSLNRGEVRTAARAAEGVIPGWDVAGVVATAAANGKGPREGTRVAALVSSGAWAEYVRVPAAHAAVIPDGVELEVAATLPIAGLTVIRALDVAGSLLGKRALITGGSGGVGQLAIQLAAHAGAIVTAVTSRDLHAPDAHEIVRAIDDAKGPFDFILESVGGPSLAAAIERVARGGVVVTIGNSSEQDTTFNARTLYAKGGASVYGLLIFEELESRRVVAADFERLLGLVAAGRLHSPIEVRRPWTETPAVLEELERRAYSGKAVLLVS